LTTAGTETQLLALIQHLDRKKIEPYLCLTSGTSESSRNLEPANCPVIRLGIRSFCHPLTLIKAWKLAVFLRRNRIDIVQVYFLDSTYFGVPVGWLAGVPHLVRTRNNIGYWMTGWHRLLGRVCNRLADGLVANCDACRQAVICDEGLSSSKIVVLENGVNLDRFQRASEESLNGADAGHLRGRRVGVVSNLRPVKNLDIFLQAAAEVSAARPDITFHIAGEGELRSALQEMANNLQIADKVYFPGTISDVPGFLAGLDVAVLCSSSEGMSNAILEYMAAGLPIVATAVGGNVQLLEDEKDGLLVTPGDSHQLALAIARLLDDPMQSYRLATSARYKAESLYSREAMIRRFEEFYVNLMAGKVFTSRISASPLPSARKF
jgi:glycosyltransferase involved in cell wall biosynthesis